MTALDWIHLLLLGGLLGMLGQGVRVVPGLKKVNDQAVRERTPFAQLFKTSELLLSLLIGFTAGALAIVGMTSGQEASKVSKDLAFALIAAGYAGTDFIEGFIKKYLPAGSNQTDKPAGETPAAG